MTEIELTLSIVGPYSPTIVLASLSIFAVIVFSISVLLTNIYNSVKLHFFRR